MTTAAFNTEISVTYPYYSREAEGYTETYNLDEIITVDGAVGPFTYNLLSTQDIKIVERGYAKMNEYVKSYMKQVTSIKSNWPTIIYNRIKGI